MRVLLIATLSVLLINEYSQAGAGSGLFQWVVTIHNPGDAEPSATLVHGKLETFNLETGWSCSFVGPDVDHRGGVLIVESAELLCFSPNHDAADITLSCTFSKEDGKPLPLMFNTMYLHAHGDPNKRSMISLSCRY
jgi:hypothetical protein